MSGSDIFVRGTYVKINTGNGGSYGEVLSQDELGILLHMTRAGTQRFYPWTAIQWVEVVESDGEDGDEEIPVAGVNLG